MTRRLFRINSVSERKRITPSSSIHCVAGKPTGMPQAFRKARMKSRLGNGFGEARFTGPRISS